MDKMVNQLLNYNAADELLFFHTNFRPASADRNQTIFVDQAASVTNQNRISNVTINLPVRFTRLRRGPRWIANN